MTDLYLNGTYAAQNPDWHSDDAPWKAAQVLAMLQKHQLVPRVVVDVGCGTGAVLAALLPQLGAGARGVGVEISPQALAMATARKTAQLDFQQGTAEVAKQAGADLAISLDVFEHVENPFEFLRQMREVAPLKLFHIPLDLSVQSVLRLSPLLRQRREVGHIHSYIKETALATLTDTGYRVKDWTYTSAMDRYSGGLGKLVNPLRKLLFRFKPDFTVRLLGGYSLLVLAE